MPQSKRRLLWQIFPSVLLVTIVSVVAASWLALASLGDFFLARTRADLEVRARLLQSEISPLLSPERRDELQSLCRSLGQQTSTRITVALPDGVVIADSEEDPARMENHGDRPEMREALAGRPGNSSRFSNTIKQNMLYLALPELREGRVQAIVRTAVTLQAMEEALHDTRWRIVAGGALIALLASIVSWWISRRIARPLEDLKEGAQNFARGEFGAMLPVDGPLEISTLAQSMNQMAKDLDERIRAVVLQRNERQAVLASMVEGVLAVDRDEKILSVNQAAARLLDLHPEEAAGRNLQEVLRNPDLQQFVEQALLSLAPVEGEIVLRGDGERFLQAHGTALRDGADQRIGVLIVLNDVTRLRRLETMRRDFVANVSHELKTPITSIKGFVETLLDGAMKSPEETERFLRIMATQADRLNAIIEDLLQLSRIEQEAEKAEIPLERSLIRPVLDAAVQACGAKTAERGVAIGVSCPSNLRGEINPPLLEQALVNLLDNAVKYSEAGSPVEIRASEKSGEIRIDVEDRGFGIEKQHLPRIFERFYRVDKSRSRKLGGTGLGLAIVKHIAQAHHGRVEVQSAPGKGSIFSVLLPSSPS